MREHAGTLRGPSSLRRRLGTLGGGHRPGTTVDDPARGLRWQRSWLRWRRRVGVHRRLVVAALVALAVVTGLRALAPQPAPTVEVLVADGDLPAGRVVTRSDVTTARWAPDTVPAGAIPDPVGRILASPLRRGEPITDARVRGPGLLVGQPDGTRATLVRLGAPIAGLVRPGDRVDLIAAPTADSLATGPAGAGAAEAMIVARDVLVLALGGAATSEAGSGGLLGTGVSAGSGEQDQLVLAVDTATALRLQSHRSGHALTVLLTTS